MKFDLIMTRDGKLKHNIKYELASKEPNINKIMNHIKQYEQDNLNTIEKLRRERKIETNKINGALKSTIKAHGPITLVLIGSATKRIWGALLSDKKENIIKKIVNKIKKWLS
jgi:hypothetical protein